MVPTRGGAVQRTFIHQHQVGRVSEGGAGSHRSVAHVNGAVGLVGHRRTTGKLQVDAADVCRARGHADVRSADKVVAIGVVISAVGGHHIGGRGTRVADRIGGSGTGTATSA